MSSDTTQRQLHRTQADQLTLEDPDDRADRMRAVVDDWVADLTDAVGTARASDHFQRWLDAQAAFHDYSYRNALLIKRQCPDATRVAGYRTWQDEFDRHVLAGESAIWIWGPVRAPACPDCQNSPSYTDHDGCEYETPQDEWPEAVVGFKPVPVFDISQTEGEPLPELDTAARGGSDELLADVLAARAPLDVEVQVVPDGAWPHGDADGVCEHTGMRPTVRVRERDRPGATAGTLLHEYAHACLHDGDLSDPERVAREVEAETVAYLAGRRLGLDTERSARYLAAWDDDASETIRERLGRIQRTAATVVEAVVDQD